MRHWYNIILEGVVGNLTKKCWFFTCFRLLETSTRKHFRYDSFNFLHVSKSVKVSPLGEYLKRIRNWASLTTPHVIWLSLHPEMKRTRNPRKGPFTSSRSISYSISKCTYLHLPFEKQSRERERERINEQRA